jgi:hypothetical protein
VDHHVGAYVKKLMASLYKVQVELNYEMWRGYKTNKSLGARMRRMHMATWLAIAWKHLQGEGSYIVEQAFVSTVLVKLDGSHNLSYRGLPGYQPPTFPQP